VKIKILGSGREVGRAGILIKSEDASVLFDYGVSVSEDIPHFPEHFAPRGLDAIALTHAHLDHSGGIPLLYVSVEPTLYVSPLTLELSELLIKDFLKISKYFVPYEMLELLSMMRRSVKTEIGGEYEVGRGILRTYEAGHIPGSTMFILEVEGKKILYTGDFNLEDSCLLRGGEISAFEKADIIIMEATYSNFNHPSREENEKRFIESLYEVLDNGGLVLVPSFAVGRAQEILCVLYKYGVEYPIYYDGMARIAAEIIGKHGEYLRDPEMYREAMGRASKIRNARMRKKILKKPCIIVSPAGMLKGGAAVSYMEKIMEDPRNGVFFVSYQVPDTPGRKVLETGIFESPNKLGKVNARVEWFDFSSHCGRNGLLEAISRTRKGSLIILVHSEEKQGEEFAEYVRSELTREVMFPANGEEIKI